MSPETKKIICLRALKAARAEAMAATGSRRVRVVCNGIENYSLAKL